MRVARRGRINRDVPSYEDIRRCVGRDFLLLPSYSNQHLIFYRNNKKIFIFLFLIALFLQIYFQLKTEYIKPNVHVVPPLPNKYSINALSLGDKEFYFRVLAEVIITFTLQNGCNIYGIIFVV